MSHRQLLTLLLIAVVVGVQFGIPSIQYFSDGANRWGWQMYSRANPNPMIVAVRADGRHVDVDVREHLSQLRSELRFREREFDLLCQRIPDVSYLRLHDPRSGEVTVHPCP
jgi:hypothetical protein